MGTTYESRAAMRTAVYRCYAADGTLLYVGASVQPNRRVAEHRASKKERSKWTTRLARVEIRWFDDRRAAEAAERRAIDEEKPVANRRRGNSPPPRSIMDLNGGGYIYLGQQGR